MGAIAGAAFYGILTDTLGRRKIILYGFFFQMDSYNNDQLISKLCVKWAVYWSVQLLHWISLNKIKVFRKVYGINKGQPEDSYNVKWIIYIL